MATKAYTEAVRRIDGPEFRKQRAFTAQESDVCCKCGNDIEIGQEISWLREPERKGNFHVACAALPTQEALTKVRVQAHDSPLGYVWLRVNAIPAGSKLGETTPATRLVPTQAVPISSTTVPNVSTDGVLLNAIATALLPALGKMVSEAIAQGEPRITVNVYCPKPGDATKALDILGKQLFLLDSVREI
jgi:hypothetical protein